MEALGGEPAVDAIGRDGFVREVERVVRRLSPTSQRLALFCLELHGIEHGRAQRLARHFAGPVGILVELPSSRFVVVRLDRRDAPAERRSLLILAAGLGETGSQARLRVLRAWSDAVVDPDYLLDELLAATPRPIPSPTRD
jgi:hypothetical protein